MIVFVPLAGDAVPSLRGPAVPRLGFTATPALRAARELTERDEEEADFAAFTFAAVAALLTGEGPRFVAAAEVEPADVVGTRDGALGAVDLLGPTWQQLLAIYTDEPAAYDALAQVRSAVAGLTLADAWQHPLVERLRATHDLLWHTPDELV